MKALNVIQLHTNRAERRRIRNRRGVPGVPALSATAPIDWSVEVPPVDRELLKQAVLLNLLGQPPVTFHRSYVDITGGVVSALWLSHAMDKTVASPNGGHVLEMTARKCEEETGITRAQQATCRRQLIALGLLSEEDRRGNVRRYRIHADRLAQCLMRQAQPLATLLRSNAEAFHQCEPPSRRHSA